MNIAIIPARGNSKRLKRKNLQLINGKPLIFYAITQAKKCKYIDEIWVTSENKDILNYSKKCGAYVIDRPRYLSRDDVPKQKVIINALKKIGKKFDYVFSIQANSPQIKYIDLNKAYEKLVKNNKSEIISVSQNLIQNAAFRIMDYKYAFQKTLSTGVCVYITDYIDIHNINDLNRTRKKMKVEQTPNS